MSSTKWGQYLSPFLGRVFLPQCGPLWERNTSEQESKGSKEAKKHVATSLKDYLMLFATCKDIFPIDSSTSYRLRCKISSVPSHFLIQPGQISFFFLKPSRIFPEKRNSSSLYWNKDKWHMSTENPWNGVICFIILADYFHYYFPVNKTRSSEIVKTEIFAVGIGYICRYQLYHKGAVCKQSLQTKADH